MRSHERTVLPRDFYHVGARKTNLSLAQERAREAKNIFESPANYSYIVLPLTTSKLTCLIAVCQGRSDRLVATHLPSELPRHAANTHHTEKRCRVVWYCSSSFIPTRTHAGKFWETR